MIDIHNTRPDPIAGSTSRIVYDSSYPFQYTNNNGWYNQAYRTVEFETKPTGDLRTWLLQNATKL